MNEWASIRRDVVFEDDAIVVLNKPVGISVIGERAGSDIVDLANDHGETLYPVHRIDKATSGIVLFAKHIAIHGDLTRQFAARTVDKSYLAITASQGLPAQGIIDLPLSVGRKNRVRIAAPRQAINFDAETSRWSVDEKDLLPGVKNYPATTMLTVLWVGDNYTLVAAKPITGRRHQIRVHLAWINHPIAGDPLFDKTATRRGERTCLHSHQLAITAAWRNNERIQLTAPPPPDFWQIAPRAKSAWLAGQ